MTQHTREPPLISSSDSELQMAEILFFTHLHANVWVENTGEDEYICFTHLQSTSNQHLFLSEGAEKQSIVN